MESKIFTDFNIKNTALEYMLVEFALNLQGILVTLEKVFFSNKNNIIIYRDDSIESVNSFKIINSKMQLQCFLVCNTSENFKNATSKKIICNFMKQKDLKINPCFKKWSL